MTVTGELAERQLSFAPVGSTRPGDETWTPPRGFRQYERTVVVGRGAEHWSATAAALLAWGVKACSGFRIEPDGATGTRVEQGEDYWLVASFGPVSVREPARVVAVVDEADRCGFAYGTLQGHPVSGEEAFIVSRAPDGQVLFTLAGRSRGPHPAGGVCCSR